MILWEAHACLPLHPQADFAPIAQFHAAGVSTCRSTSAWT
jgi:membrane dipeptidase